MEKKKGLKDKLIPVLFLVGTLLLWQGGVKFSGVEKFIMPSPKDVITAIFMDFNNMLPHIYQTLYEAIFGLAIAIVLALVLAIVMDLVPFIKKGLYPLLVVSQTVPIIALAPLFIIWFGFGSLPKILVVVLVCFFPIVISLSDGLEGVEEDLINHFKLMGASKLKIFFHLKLPYGIIMFFSGLKIAATYSVMGAIIGEWLGGNKGLGVYMTRAKSTYALDKMFGAIVIIVILSMGIFYAVGAVEKLYTPWKKKNMDGE